jgi:hypothetical protein
MAFPNPSHLSAAKLAEILGTFSPGAELAVTKFRYKNGAAIRRVEIMPIESVRALLLESIDIGTGYDFELRVPTLDKTLVGHHDGVFWLE